MSQRGQLEIVCLGGGTGLAYLLRGLKRLRAHVTAIVTLTDDGGSGAMPELMVKLEGNPATAS